MKNVIFVIKRSKSFYIGPIQDFIISQKNSIYVAQFAPQDFLKKLSTYLDNNPVAMLRMHNCQ